MHPGSVNLRRSKPRTFVLLATAATLAAGAVAIPASAFADEPAPVADAAPLPPTLSGAGSWNPFAGLNGTQKYYLNARGTALDDAWIRIDIMDDQTGVTLPGPGSTYHNPDCSQPGGAGTTVLCGPYTLAPGESIAPNLAFDFPSDYLLEHGQSPAFEITGTLVDGAGVELGVPPTTSTMRVVSDIYLTTGIRVNPVETGTGSARSVGSGGAVAGPTGNVTLPAVGRYEVTSPDIRDIELLVAHGGYSDVRDISASVELPAELTIRDVPDQCTQTGQLVECDWALARAGTAYAFHIPVTVASDLPDGTVIPIADPVVTVASPNEPAGKKTTWNGNVVGSPYTMVVNGRGELPVEPEVPVEPELPVNPPEPVVDGPAVITPVGDAPADASTHLASTGSDLGRWLPAGLGTALLLLTTGAIALVRTRRSPSHR